MLGSGSASPCAFSSGKRRYDAWSYWLVVVMVAIFGTTAADALHVVLGIPYLYSTSFYIVVLAAVFISWYRSEGTLSIHSISTRRRENYYWASVLATFALGTAGGGLDPRLSFDLGYLYLGGTVRGGVRDSGGRGTGASSSTRSSVSGSPTSLTRPLGAPCSLGPAAPSQRGLRPDPLRASHSRFLTAAVVWLLAAHTNGGPARAAQPAEVGKQPTSASGNLEVAPAVE